MESWDDRGQSIQIGAVLIFAALILLVSLYQATIVPQQNEQIEFDHSQQVQGELLDLRNAVTSAVGDAARRSVSVTLGTTYPPRFLAVNPPPASGQLRTVGTGDSDVAFGVTNATALDAETGDFWDGDRRDYGTGGIVYRPSYSEYGQPPSTVYENSVLYDDFSFEGTTIARSEQALVDGNTITLVALNGSLRRSSSGSLSVDVRPVSASTRTVAVRNADPDSNVTVRVPTRLSESRWAELLADEFVGEGGNVTDVRTNPLPAAPEYRMLVVDMVPGTYDLRMAKAGVGTRVTGTDAAYLTEVRGNGTSVPEGATRQFVVEVRDRYNNPVSGATVRAASDGTGTVGPATARTDESGRVRLTYRAPPNIEGDPVEARVNASYSIVPGSGSFAGETPENVSMSVTVLNTDGSGTGAGTGGGGGGNDAYATLWEDPSGQPAVSCDAEGDDCTLDAGQSTTLQATAGTVPTAENATAYFSIDDSAVATPSPWRAPTDGDGRVSTTFTATANGDVKLYVWSGGSGDVINLTVENYDAGGGTAADTVELVGGSTRAGQTGTGSLAFDLRNTGTSGVTIERVSVDVPTRGDVKEIYEQNGGTFCTPCNEMYFDMDDEGYYESGDGPNGGYALATPVTLDDAAGIDGGSDGTVALSYFRKSNGNREPIGGETVTVTVTFADGSSETYTLNP
ncbi:Ig-like domain-containing protein [Halosimplex salinum]|uniref:Ig-like domain-containing protein n=1 Tax=Halosimplex salinum TaxID=1710538 RepID=UPI000F465000|nr:Ig-like domain-containing protein [Halosimplex salinum]